MPATARIEAVIFDCDGTLVDSEPLTLQALREEAAGAGIFLGQETWDAFRGTSIPFCMDAIAALSGATLPRDFEQGVRARMASLFRQGLQAIPGAAEVLRRLRLPYCVATNGPRAKVELTLTLTGLLPYLAGRIFCAPEVGFYKPDPRLFLAAAAALDVPAQHCAVVEDSPTGIAAAVAAGMQVYALQSPHLPRDLPPRVHVLDSLAQLLQSEWHNESGGG